MRRPRQSELPIHRSSRHWRRSGSTARHFRPIPIRYIGWFFRQYRCTSTWGQWGSVSSSPALVELTGIMPPSPPLPLGPLPVFSWPSRGQQPNDVSWNVCDTTGFAGQAMTMTVANRACSVPEDVFQVSSLSLDAPGTGNDGMCDLCAEYVLEVSERGEGRTGESQVGFWESRLFCSAELWHGCGDVLCLLPGRALVDGRRRAAGRHASPACVSVLSRRSDRRFVDSTALEPRVWKAPCA